MRSGERAGLLAIVVSTLLWGATFVVIRDSVREVDPKTLVLVRFAAATFLLALVAVARRARWSRDTLVAGALGGACAAGGYLFQAMGLQFTAAGTSAFLTCTGTLFAALFAWALLRERPSGLLMAGIAVALVGAGLLPADAAFQFGPGEAWTLLGAMAFALQIVAIARQAPRVDPVALTLAQCATLTLILAPFARPAALDLGALGPAGLARIGYLVIAGSAVAPLLQVIAQRTLKPGRVGLLFALEPVFALGFAVTAGGERFVGTWWIGAALILAAVTGVELAAARSQRTASP